MRNLSNLAWMLLMVSTGLPSVNNARNRTRREHPPRSKVRLFSIESTPISNCKTGSNNVVVVYKVVIASGFDINKNSRKVLYNPYSAAAEDDKSDSGTPDRPMLRDLYHVDVSAFTANANEDKWAEIRVVLRDNDYVFGSGTIASGNVDGVGSGGGIQLCSLEKRDATVNSPGGVSQYAMRAFYVKLRPSSTPVFGYYNIILQSRYAQETPIIIDPKIKNNG